MEIMFKNCSSLASIDLSNFDTSKVTDMRSMFYGCGNLTSVDLSNFDVSQETYMYDMFFNCSKLNIIRSPKKTGEEVPNLPEGTWKDSSGNTYSTLPANATESITLTRE